MAPTMTHRVQFRPPTAKPRLWPLESPRSTAARRTEAEQQLQELLDETARKRRIRSLEEVRLWVGWGGGCFGIILMIGLGVNAYLNPSRPPSPLTPFLFPAMFVIFQMFLTQLQQELRLLRFAEHVAQHYQPRALVSAHADTVTDHTVAEPVTSGGV